MIQSKDIDGGKAFDWGRTSKDYARFRDIYPPEFYQNIIDLGLCVQGQNVLDLGTGTGVLPRNLYQYGANFVGADISENQIAEARRMAQESGMDIEYIVSSAEEVHFPDNTFDVVTACQCFLYFDKSIVLPHIHAMLKPDGHFCILWMAWLPEEDHIVGESERLVLKYNPSWTGAGFSRTEQPTPEWVEPLFKVEHALAFDTSLRFTRESWHGRIKACRGIGASSLSESAIQAFEQEHLKLLQTFPETFEILHYVTILDLTKASHE